MARIDRMGRRSERPDRTRRHRAARRGAPADRRVPLRAIVLPVIALCVWASLLPGVATTPSAGAQVVPDPRPIPAPAQVSITDAGYEPASVALATGQSVVFTNDSAVDQTVAASTGLFDSGPIPPGGAFSLALDEPGFHEIAASTDPVSYGTLTVGPLAIAGPPDQLVRAHLPEIETPPVTDPDEIPGVGVGSSRTRLLVMFAETTTVGQANAALAEADVTIIGTIVGINTVVVVTDDAGVGNFDPVFAAAATLRADPAVEVAALDLARDLATVPALAESSLSDNVNTDPNTWTWEDERYPNGSGKGSGGNWGLEASRFPQAWNFLDPIRMADNVVDTLVLDLGFAPHDELASRQWKQLCYGGRCNADIPVDARNTHATHVSGTIGAAWDNPKDGEPGKRQGIDGANPVVRLYGASATGGAVGTTSVAPQSTWYTSAVNSKYVTALEGKSTGLWPNLRVMNMSLGSLQLSRESSTDSRATWGRLMGSRRCGPGANDDSPTTAGPATGGLPSVCSPQRYRPRADA